MQSIEGLLFGLLGSLASIFIAMHIEEGFRALEKLHRRIEFSGCVFRSARFPSRRNRLASVTHFLHWRRLAGGQQQQDRKQRGPHSL